MVAHGEVGAHGEDVAHREAVAHGEVVAPGECVAQGYVMAHGEVIVQSWRTRLDSSDSCPGIESGNSCHDLGTLIKLHTCTDKLWRFIGKCPAFVHIRK